MRVEFNICGYNRAFCGARSRKLIEKVQRTEKMDKLKVSFDELERMYNEIGYDVLYKRGSHAIVHVTDTINIPIVIPHKTKDVHPFDLVRFKYVLNGEFEKASQCR